MEGGHSFDFIVNINVRAVPCKNPFVPVGYITSPYSIDVGDSSSKMPLISYTWTNPDPSCNVITVVFSSSSSISTSYLTLSDDILNARY